MTVISVQSGLKFVEGLKRLCNRLQLGRISADKINEIIGRKPYEATETVQSYQALRHKISVINGGLYQKVGKQLKSLEGAICSKCSTKKTSKWCKDFENKTDVVCFGCYQKVRKQLKSSEGVICSSDLTEVDVTAAEILSSRFSTSLHTPVVIKEEPIHEVDLNPPRLHRINNFLPILQDPQDPSRSCLIEEEGPIDGIYSVKWADELSGLTKRQQERIRKEMREWLTLNEYHREEYASKLSQLYEIATPIELGPDRGRSVYAKKKISKYQVIGPYSGRLHKDAKSLDAAIEKEGSYPVLSYLFCTRAQNRTINALNTGNTMSLVNSGNLPNKEFKDNNVAPVCFGKNLIFYIALKDIKVQDELLVDYGPDYNPM